MIEIGTDTEPSARPWWWHARAWLAVWFASVAQEIAPPGQRVFVPWRDDDGG